MMTKTLKKLRARWFKAIKYNSIGINVKDLNLKVKDVDRFISANMNKIRSLNNDIIFIKRQSDINYEITSLGCTYNTDFDTIRIGIGDRCKNMTEDEMMEYLSDSITHEHIHRILFKHMSYEISAMFDAIGYLFRNSELQYKALTGTIHHTHEEVIKIKGFKNWLKATYLIDENRIKEFKELSKIL